MWKVPVLFREESYRVFLRITIGPTGIVTLMSSVPVVSIPVVPLKCLNHFLLHNFIVSTSVSDPDPDSGVFWIRIPNPDPDPGL